jgi:molybdopterin/thiamine biosynthesis adenylyltransferase
MTEPNANLLHTARDQPIQPMLIDGQSIKLVGIGGIGCIAARFGAMLLAPLAQQCSARLVLIDGDTFEPGNATRMFFSTFGNKAAVLRDELRSCFRDTRLGIEAIEEYVTPESISRLLLEGDIVLAAVDNHATRKLLSDHCAALRDVVLISCGNDGIGSDSTGKARRGTYGNCQIYIRREGRDVTPSLTRFHVEIQHPADRLPSDRDCIELAGTVPQNLLANLLAASSLLNALWLTLSDSLHYSELAFDIADGIMRPISTPPPSSCGVR